MYEPGPAPLSSRGHCECLNRTGLNGVAVPGTLRDSLVLLSVVLEQQTELQPTEIMTDTGAYTDTIFGIFHLLGYQFSPRLADIGGSRFWRVDGKADYGALNNLAAQRINLGLIAEHWEDLLRLAGSLKLGIVQAAGPIRTLQTKDRPTKLARALGGARSADQDALPGCGSSTARDIAAAFLSSSTGARGATSSPESSSTASAANCASVTEGQEDQLGALGLVVNVIVLLPPGASFPRSKPG